MNIIPVWALSVPTWGEGVCWKSWVLRSRKERYFIGGGSGGAEEGGGGCAGVVCRIVPVAPQAQAGLIPFTADSRRDKNKGSARGGDSRLVRGVLKHTSSNWVEDCGRMPQKSARE